MAKFLPVQPITMASWLVANMVEDHHGGVPHAACGRWRAPGVMTTTLVQSYYYLSFLSYYCEIDKR